MVIQTKVTEDGSDEQAEERADSADLQDISKVIVLTADYPLFMDESVEGKGIFTEMVEAIMKETNLDYEIEWSIWPRIEPMLEDGEAWAAFYYVKTPEREEKFLFTDPFTESHSVFFYHEDGKITGDIPFSTVKDLKEYTFGGNKSYFYSDDWKEVGLNVEWATTDDGLINMLKYGRIDLLFYDEIVGWDLIKKYAPDEADKFRTLSTVLNTDPLYLMVSASYQDTEKIIAEFNQAIKSFKEKGLELDIYKKHGIER